MAKVVRVKAGQAKRPGERWTIERQATFLAALVRTVNVSASAKAAGTSDASVYRHRAKSPEFRAAWATALREGYARLELMMLERAINGQTRPVFFGGNKIGEITEYSDKTALALLAAHRGLATGADPAAPPVDEDAQALLKARLIEMHKRLTDAG